MDNKLRKLDSFTHGDFTGTLYEEDTPYIHSFTLKLDLWGKPMSFHGQHLEQLIKDLNSLLYVMDQAKDAINEQWKKLDRDEEFSHA